MYIFNVNTGLVRLSGVRIDKVIVFDTRKKLILFIKADIIQGET
jgi:hypothetical protein